jgi:hypothetical protein
MVPTVLAHFGGLCVVWYIQLQLTRDYNNEQYEERLFKRAFRTKKVEEQQIPES